MGEMARQPDLVRAIKQEMEDPQFRVRVEWIEVEEFFERFASTDSKGKMGAGKDSGGSPLAISLAKAARGRAKARKATSQNLNLTLRQSPPSTKAWLAAKVRKAKSQNLNLTLRQYPPSTKAARGRAKARKATSQNLNL